MSILTHAVTYQGLPCTGMAYRRSEGLSPEYGWVDIDLAVLKKIHIVARNIPWRPANEGLNIPSQLAIDAWNKIYRRQTVSRPPVIPAPEGGGLNRFGDLVLITYEDGKEIHRQTYVDVYVNDAGIEEITRGLLNAKAHSEGTVRVPLTDIRKFYPDCGALCQRINCKTRTGEWEPGTVHENLKPWSAQEVVRHLLSQLPGMPLVMNSQEFDALKLAPPTDIAGEGDAVLPILQRVLEQLGLVALLQPDNNYAVFPRLSSGMEYGKVPQALGKSIDGSLQHDETKTVWISDRPPMTQVFGKRRVRRKTLVYVPIFRDTDGKYYRLADIDKVWRDYSIEEVNRNVFLAPQKSFRDVPPGDFKKLHHERRKLIREWAYRGYAPACYFTEGNPPSFTDEDLQRMFFLPMKEVPFYVDELANLGIRYPRDVRPQKGDRADFVLLPSLAQGQTVGQTFFPDFKEIAKYFQQMISRENNAYQWRQDYLDVAKQELQQMGLDHLRAQQLMNEAFDAAKARTQLNIVGDIAGIRDFRDLEMAFGEMTVPIATQKTAEEQQVKVNTLEVKAKIQRETIKAIETQIRDQGLRVATWRQKYTDFEKAYKDREGGVQAWTTLAHGVIASGAYSLDERTGIVLFSEPYCVAQNPFWLDGDPIVVAGDGLVSITFGYELNDNSTEDFTSFLFSSEGQEPRISLCGVNRSSPISARPERAPNMRLYEADNGTPINFTQCYTEALGRVAGQLSVRSTVEGYTYVYDGLLQAVLDGGVTSIQHEWDLKSAGRTHVMVNAPNSRGPLGPARLSGDVRRTQEADARWMIEAAKNA